MPDYDYSGSSAEMEAMLEEMFGAGFGAVLAMYLVIFLIALAVGAVCYVLQSLAYYKIANRRGIDHAWLAWVPVGSTWILGCISDQYQYVVNRRVCNKRKTLLVLSIVLVVLYIAMICCSVGMFVELIEAAGAGEMDNFTGAMTTSATVVLLSLVMAGVAIAFVIIQYMAMYDLFRSCDTANGTLYLVGSILVNTVFSGFSFLQPVFLFLCRDKDEGMPARKPTTYS